GTIHTGVVDVERAGVAGLLRVEFLRDRQRPEIPGVDDRAGDPLPLLQGDLVAVVELTVDRLRHRLLIAGQTHPVARRVSARTGLGQRVLRAGVDRFELTR